MGGLFSVCIAGLPDAIECIRIYMHNMHILGNREKGRRRRRRRRRRILTFREEGFQKTSLTGIHSFRQVLEQEVLILLQKSSDIVGHLERRRMRAGGEGGGRKEEGREGEEG